MRIISGKNKGRKIQAPKKLPVRPTTDMAKESLFNILNNHIYFEDVSVLDLFAGTGSISYEFASRGAVSVMAIDENRHCIRFIDKTAATLQFDNLSTLQTDYEYFLRRTHQQWDIIFADPPYQMEEAYQKLPDLIFQHKLLKEGGYFVLEHPAAHSFETHPHFLRERRYGRVHFSFFGEKTEE